eukprot:3679742-Pyramimonas_sp.AAC.1
MVRWVDLRAVGRAYPFPVLSALHWHLRRGGRCPAERGAAIGAAGAAALADDVAAPAVPLGARGVPVRALISKSGRDSAVLSLGAVPGAFDEVAGCFFSTAFRRGSTPGPSFQRGRPSCP